MQGMVCRNYAAVLNGVLERRKNHEKQGAQKPLRNQFTVVGMGLGLVWFFGVAKVLGPRRSSAK